MDKSYPIFRIDDPTTYRIIKAAEEAGLTALRAITSDDKELESLDPKITISFNSGLPWKVTESEVEKSKPGQHAIEIAAVTFTLRVSGESARRIPGQNKETESVRFSLERPSKEGVNGLLRIRTDAQIIAMNSDGAQRVLKAIHESISMALKPTITEDAGLIPSLTNLAENFSTTYQNISSELSSALARVNDERINQINEFKKEREKLRLEIASERENMLQAVAEDSESMKNEIAKERAEIETARLNLELSSHKDSRRRQFLTLQKDVQDLIQTPVAGGGLRKIRWAVFMALMAAGVAASFLAYASVSASTFFGDFTTAAWVMAAIRSSILTLAALGSFLGAAAWLRYFYVRDLQAHEDLIRFRNDMARASWTMDAALEIRKEHDEEIPAEWLSGVTQGLFSKGSGKSSLEEGAQALAALLALSASASVGPGGLSVDLNKKGRRVLSEAAQEMDRG